MFEDAWFAERHHWPPEVVDRLPAYYAERLPLFAKAWDQALANRRGGG